MKQQLLLLEDVDALGKKGEIVSARPGFTRNYLLPQGFAVVATPNMLRKQERLRAERAQQAIIDRQKSDELAQKIEGLTVEITVKVDPEGHMYGSVSALDITNLLVERGLPVERRNVAVNKPIKETGLHKITLRLKEGVNATFQLKIIPEGVAMTGIENVVKPIPVEGAEAPAESPATEPEQL
ncbi:MAG: 50S ribosomal protein L9 [Verrucomicrobiota bacterium]|nr:50S ribosomal protein L9 [Verrucomicrobiota bacterium]